MDSRLIAGAYSQHFRALEREENEREELTDTITRAKKLSQETNKRRRVQAQKRKLEAKREEKRRQDILNKRKDEQKQATEKYQRSHVPNGQRQNSADRASPQRYNAPGLDDALQLIRRSPRRDRPSSGKERILSPRSENTDPLNRSYFNKRRLQSARPSSGRTGHSMNNEARAELMDYSLKNLTSSKSLFEQQLEQQQNMLLQEQEQSLREFSNAVKKELDFESFLHKNARGDNDNIGNDIVGNFEIENVNETCASLSGSCSSLDSLEAARNESEINDIVTEKNLKETHFEFNDKENPCVQGQSSSGNQQSFYLNPYLSSEQGSNVQHGESHSIPYRHDLTPSALFQIDLKNDNDNVGLPSGMSKADLLEMQSRVINHDSKTPVKQTSEELLEESCSSNSSISLIKLPETTSEMKNKMSEIRMLSQPSSIVSTTTENYKANNSTTMIKASDNRNTEQSRSDASQPLPSTNRNEPVVEGYNPRYASAIGLSIWPGHSSAPNTSTTPSPPPIQSTVPPTVQTDSVKNNGNSPYGKRTKTVTIPANSVHVAAQQNNNISNPSTHSNTLQNTSNLDRSNNSVSGGNRNLNCAQSGDNNMRSTSLPVSSDHSSSTTLTPNNSNSNIPHVDSNLLNSFKKQDFIYPLPQTSLPQQQNTNNNSGNSVVAQNQNHNHVLLPSHSATYNTLQQEINQLSNQMLMDNNNFPSSMQHHNYAKNSVSEGSQNSIKTLQVSQIVHHIPHANDATALTSPVAPPVPAVRTIFPTNKPPVPKMLGTATLQQNAVSNNPSKSTRDASTINSQTPADNIRGEEDQCQRDEVDGDVTVAPMPKVKGILKPSPAKIELPVAGQRKGGVQVRDSLELAKMQNEKKVKKKSVTFAAKLEETQEEYYAAEEAVVEKKTLSTRPSSAKAPYQSFTTSKQIRASSAGSVRQQPATNSQQQHNQSNNSRVHFAIENSSNSSLSSRNKNSAISSSPSDHTGSGNNKSNLPPNLSPPLSSNSNTNYSATMNRPKAAAHIIMSSEMTTSKENNNPNAGIIGFPKSSSAVPTNNSASVHKSQLDMKVKTINNNFMTKIPVRQNVMNTNGNIEVYHVTSTSNTAANNTLINSPLNDRNNHYLQQQTSPPIAERSRIRDNSSSLKRVPLSNSTVTRTSIIPASTKINYPVQNGIAPSYSTAQGGGGSSSTVMTYDESKIPIDKTPTDEEISWLWDKVRTCLDKDGGDKASQAASLAMEQQAAAARQTPTLSTKIIDGNSLGFNTAGVPALRPGSGYFYGRNGNVGGASATNNAQNKIKPAIQQQGSYLRRYGLLQQRRVHSATGTPNNNNNVMMQARAGSAGLAGRYPSSSQNNNQTHQQQQQLQQQQMLQQQAMENVMAQPLAYSYKPTENVSESTAAFTMAERLAKQSLTDSHIAVGMDDAHHKQEVYNNRNRMVSKGGGPSALSMEEQKLMESLDKLNEKLNVTEQQKAFSGTIHYHQPYQPHLSGFRGHQAFNGQRHQNMSQRGQPRSQSARIRQQIRQYR